MKTREEWRLEKSASDESPTGRNTSEIRMILDIHESEAQNVGV